MVISTVNQVVYNGDGITTAWPFTFRIIDATDIKLLLIDADGTETDVSADYYVDMVNNTVYYPGYAPGAEPPEEDQPPKVQTGQKLVVYRELPITQEADLGEKWPFNVIELGLDKLTMILQQIFGWWGRALKFGVGWQADHPDFNTEIPIEAGKTWRVNDDGTGFVVSNSSEAAMSVAQNAKNTADAAALAAGGAVSVANEAKNTADGIAGVAADAKTLAEGAVSTANDAKNTAEGIANSKLSLSGGTMTGDIQFANGQGISKGTNADALTIAGGTDTPGAASLTLNGSASGTANAGSFALRSTDGANTYVLSGNSSGVLNWKNQRVLTDEDIDIIDVKQYGAKGDGVTDDTVAIQSAISANPARCIFFPDGTYLVSETIKTSRNQYKYSRLELSRYAVIKASADFDGQYLINIGGLDNNYSSEAPAIRCDFVGGVLDCSGVTNGIYIHGQTTMIYDTIIRGCASIGVYGDTNTYCEEVYMEGPDGAAGSIGLVLNATDNVQRRVRTKGFETGIQINASSVILEGCHPFYGSTINDATYQNSAGFEINATRIFLTDCYSDNFAMGVHITGAYSVFSVNFELFYLTKNKNINRYFVKQDSGNFVSSFVNSVCSFPDPNAYPGNNYGYSGSTVYGDNASFENTSITGGATYLTLGYNDLLYSFEQRIVFPGGTSSIYQNADVLGMAASRENGAWTGSGILLGAKGGTRDGEVIISAEGTNGAKQLILKNDGTLKWNGQKVHNGTATNVWSDFTPSESQYGAVFYDVGFMVFCGTWIGANKAHSVNDLLFTVDANHLPIDTTNIPFVYENGLAYGSLRVDNSNGQVTVRSISSTSAVGRILIGGCCWVKKPTLW